MARAYRKTLGALRRDPRLRPFRPRGLRAGHDDWGAVVRQYLRCVPAADGGWKQRVESSLARKGYSEGQIRDHVLALAEAGELLADLAALYLPPLPKPSPR